MDSKTEIKSNNKKMLKFLIKNDFKNKYAGSIFGVFWAFVQPVVIILLYWFVFQVALGSGDEDGAPFVLWLMAGLVPWFFFSDAWAGATNCFIEYSYLVKKIVFDIKLLPLVKVASTLYVHVFFVAIMVLFYVLTGRFPGIIIIQLLYYSFCLFVLVLVLSYFTSAIAVFFKDVTQIINIVITIGIWLTPIMWNISRLKGIVSTIIRLNPVFYIVQGYRDTLINHIWIGDRLLSTGYFWGVVVICGFVSYFVYNRLKPHFSDTL